MKRIYLISAGMCCLLLMASCGSKSKEKQDIQSVRVEKVMPNDEKNLLQYPGKVKAAQDINISFRVSGTIDKIHVKDGEYVKEGQLLAEMDPTDYEIQLKGTEAKYKEVKAEADRVIALYKTGGTTPNNYDKAVYGLEQITALYNHHKDQLAYTRLYAPFNGYIQKHVFEAHETVGAGMPVLAMISSGVPEVEINLPAAEYIRRGQFSRYHCTFELYPNQIFPLKLIGITRKANANQLYTMRLLLDAKGLPMPSPGMNTMVSIFYDDDADHSMQVPGGSVLHKDDKSYVYIYQADKSCVNLCEVSMVKALSNGRYIVNSDQLKPGDTVVSAGIHFIKDGETVKIVAPVTSTNIGGLL